MGRKRLEEASSLPRALSPYESIGSEANLLLSKEKEDWRYWENWGSGLHNEQQGALRAKGVLRNHRERDERRKTSALGTRSSDSLWSLLAPLVRLHKRVARHMLSGMLIPVLTDELSRDR